MLKSVSFTLSSPAGLVQPSGDLRPVCGLQSVLHYDFSGYSLCCDYFFSSVFVSSCIDLVSTEFRTAECTDQVCVL